METEEHGVLAPENLMRHTASILIAAALLSLTASPALADAGYWPSRDAATDVLGTWQMGHLRGRGERGSGVQIPGKPREITARNIHPQAITR